MTDAFVLQTSRTLQCIVTQYINNNPAHLPSTWHLQLHMSHRCKSSGY